MGTGVILAGTETIGKGTEIAMCQTIGSVEIDRRTAKMTSHRIMAAESLCREFGESKRAIPYRPMETVKIQTGTRKLERH